MRDPHVKVLYNKRGVSDYALYDEAGIAERYLGVTPAQYTDYAALRGDTSDNLPGVPGIGEKTAAKLITTYDDLEGIFEHLDELPPKQKTNLGEFRDRVFKNREMSRLDLDVDCGIEIDELAPGRVRRRARCGCCSTSSSSARLLPRLLDAIGEVAEVPEADVLEVDGRHRARRAGRREPRCSKPASRRGSRSNRVGRASAAGARVVGLAIATDAAVTYIDAELFAQDGARQSARRARRRRLPGARRAPLEGADARARRRAASPSSTTPR